MELKEKRVSVLGLGERTGPAVIEFLQQKGAKVFVSEASTSSPFQGHLSGVEIEFGGHSSRVYKDKDLIVVSPGVPSDIPILKEALQAGVPAWSEVELAYRFSQARFIAVTGTNGKSTVASLLGLFLGNLDQKVVVAGNIGVPLISKVTRLEKNDFVVAEVSSFQLELIEKFKPEIAVILNVAPDHLNRHRGMENYFAIKKKIFHNQKKEDLLVLNYDNTWTKSLEEEITLPQKIWYSLEKKVNGFYLEGKNLIDGLQQKTLLETGDVKIPGGHNLGNVLVAAGIASLLGVSSADIKREASRFKGLPHTMELVGEISGVRFINDSKGTNPEATVSAIKGLPGNKVLIAGGQDRGLDLKGLARAISEEKIRALILTGENKDKIKQAVLLEGYQEVFPVERLKDAVWLAWEKAQKGDWILFSPGAASWDQYQNFAERGSLFKKLVNEIEGRGADGTPRN